MDKTNKKTFGLAFFNASGRKAAHLLPGDQDMTQTAGGGQSGCGKRKANIGSKASRTQPPSGSPKAPCPRAMAVWGSRLESPRPEYGAEKTGW